MDYKLNISIRADELLDNLIYYLLNEYDNVQAAKHLIDEIEKMYKRIKDNPLQFPMCRDEYLRNKGYYEAILTGMDYVIIFTIKKDEIYILGIYHWLENYQIKL